MSDAPTATRHAKGSRSTRKSSSHVTTMVGLSMEATTDEREGRIDMTVEINDLKHLEKVIKSLRGVDGVLNVERSTR